MVLETHAKDFLDCPENKRVCDEAAGLETMQFCYANLSARRGPILRSRCGTGDDARHG